MPEPEKNNWPELIAELVNNRVSIHKIAELMSNLGVRTQYTQVKRWSVGKCQWISDAHASTLRKVYAENVSHETLQR